MQRFVSFEGLALFFEANEDSKKINSTGRVIFEKRLPCLQAFTLY